MNQHQRFLLFLMLGVLTAVGPSQVQGTGSPPPVNDSFTNAARLPGPFEVSGATLEPGEPAHRGSEPTKSLWWNYQPPHNGSLGISCDRSLLTNITVAVYTGNSLDTLTLVNKGTNIVHIGDVNGGTVFHIAAAVPADAEGEVLLDTYLNISWTSRPVPGDILLDGSFEGTGLLLTNWTVSAFIGGSVNELGGADGKTWLSIHAGTKLWQDFPTVPGRVYELRFAWGGDGIPARILWNSEVLGTVEVPATEPYWHWTNFTVTADSYNTRLMITNVIEPWFWLLVTNQMGLTNYVLTENTCCNISLDGFSVVWLHEPATILTPPASVSVPEGGTAAFTVGVRGIAPLSFQWLRDGNVLPGATNRTLLINPVTASQAGSYVVEVTNLYGSVTSAPATLTVESSGQVAILLQPYGDTVADRGYYMLSVVTVGLPPPEYQWFKDGQLLAGATNRQLTFLAVQPSDAGNYAVRVSNSNETVWSLSATLNVAGAVPGGGLLLFANRFTAPPPGTVVDAPFFDVDGTTRLSGSNFSAQLYAGPTVALLRPAGLPVPFRTGLAAGYVSASTVTLPNVLPTSNAVVQVRAWDATRAFTFEEARAQGARFGKSGSLQVRTGSGVVVPGFLIGLQSFQIRAGLPQFNVGVIELFERQPNGDILWSLRGEPDSRYLIERATNGFVWSPLMVITNVSGTVIFSDPSGSQAGNVFYHSRILD
jgi:hypothetical protein